MLQSICTLAPVFTCLFWGLALWNIPGDKRHSKRILALFMFALSILYLAHASYFSSDKLLYQYFDDIYIFVSLLVFPLFYLYIVSITKESIHQKKYLWHIAPAFLFFLAYIIFSFTLTQKEMNYYMLNFIHANTLRPLSITYRPDELAFLFLLTRAVYLLQVFTYPFLALRLMRIWKKRLLEGFSETEGKELRQVEILSCICFSLSAISFLMDSFGRYFVQEQSIILLIPALLSAPLFYKAGLIGYKQSFTIVDLEEDEKETIQKDNIETGEQPSKISQGLTTLMEEKRIYLIPDLRISTVCEELHTNRTYLSQVLNDELKENFNSFVNRYRVNYAITLLQDSQWNNYSLDKFAELSGFGSTISMIRAFKQFTGKTPSEYRK